jgi:hypothetical protein
MRAQASLLLRAGVACLALSLASALLLASSIDVLQRNHTLVVLDSWLERTLFWVGLIFAAAFALDRVYVQHRD